MKGFLLFCLVIIIVAMVISSGIAYWQMEMYRKQWNQVIMEIIAPILEQYPEQEEEIVQILEGEKQTDKKKVETLLAKYGINTQKELASYSLEKEAKATIYTSSVLIGLVGLSLILSFAIYMILRDRKIKQITEYLKQVQRGDYSMQIEDNVEGELSKLKNEIYKITVTLKEQAQMLQEDKIFLSNAISDISHQIKTPITSLGVMIDILKENKDLPEEKRQEFLYEVARQLEWIKWLVISLLKLSKLDAGTIALKKENIEIKQLLQTVIQDLSIPIEIKNQEVILQGKEGVSFIGDFNWTTEALVNIVKNCLEHTKENAMIKIAYSQNALYTEIVIEDSGEGIAKEDLPNIFKRFYKGKNASKESVGIGLALAKSIIQNQGGDISVKSKLGEGTTFSVKFYQEK